MMLYFNRDWGNICLQRSGVFQFYIYIYIPTMCSFTGNLKASRWEGSRLFLLVYQTTFDPVAMVSLSFCRAPRCCSPHFPPDLPPSLVYSRWALKGFPWHHLNNKGYVPSPLVKEISKELSKNYLYTAFWEMTADMCYLVSHF